MRKLLRLCGSLMLLLGLSLSLVAAEETWPPREYLGKHSVPENVRIVLSADREEYFLGENVLVHFSMENTGGPAFQAEFGGDYRGSPRALRFRVTAVDEHGSEVADPYPNGLCFGGFGGPEEITPEKPFHNSIPILRYLRFEEPGKYVIRVQHASGWKPTPEWPLPVAEITLTFKRPNPEQARELAQTWLNQPPYHGQTWGKKGLPHADFSQIRCPEYLPTLTEAARAGSKNGITGVGSIATPEATQLLLELVNTLQGDQQKQACDELCERLPDPHLKETMENRSPFVDHWSYRRWMVAHAWDGSLTDEVRKVAAKFLVEDDPKLVATGAYMLECVGTVSDKAILIAAMDREILRTKSPPPRADVFPRPQDTCMKLQRAARMMQLQGAEIPTLPDSPGESLLFLVALRHDESFRPADWVQTCERLLQSDIAHLQEQTLLSLSSPIPVELHSRLPKILAAADVDASRAACDVIAKEKLVAFKQPVLKLLRRATEDWQFRAASNAAIAVGAEPERPKILVDRLDENGMLFECLNGLKTIFDNVGGGGVNRNIDLAAEARRIKPLWRALIAKHAEDFKAGAKLTLPHPDVTPEMFPEKYTMTLRKGGEWPPPKK